MSNGQIVPFGKYKGRQVEEMIADRQYCDWLQAQPWFSERFPQMRVLIMNVGQEPQETPEHNEMQARFLDPAYCVRLWRALDQSEAVKEVITEAQGAFVSHVYEHQARLNALVERRRHFEEKLIEAQQEARITPSAAYLTVRHANEISRCEAELPKAEEGLAKALELAKHEADWFKEWSDPTAYDIKFEVAGWDVVYYVRFGPTTQPLNRHVSGYNTRIVVECKPSVADDYPTVMRQVLARKHVYADGIRVVFADRVCPSSVTPEQVHAIFNSRGIHLIDNSKLGDGQQFLIGAS